MRAGARRLYRGVKRNQVGLIGDAANAGDNGADAVGGVAEIGDIVRDAVQLARQRINGLHALLDHAGAVAGALAGLQRGLISLLCGVALLLIFLYLRRHVGGELHHLIQPALAIKHRVIGGAQPDGLPLFIDPLELAGDKLAAVKLFPERFVFGALAQRFGTEAAVRQADHLVGAVAHGFKKVGVCLQHFTFEVKGDHRHRPLNRGGHGALLLGVDNTRGDIGRQLDDFHHAAMAILHRHIVGFQPDRTAVLRQAQKFVAKAFAALQAQPEVAIL